MNSTTLPPSAAPSPSPFSLGAPPEANGSIIHVTHPGSTEAGWAVTLPRLAQLNYAQDNYDTQHVTLHHVSTEPSLPIISIATNDDSLDTLVGPQLPQRNVRFQSYPQPIFNGNGNYFLPNAFNNETGNNNSYCFGTIPQQVPFDNTITLANPVPQVGFTTGPQYTSLPQVDFNNQGYQLLNPTSLLEGNSGNMMYYTPSVMALQYANFGTSNYQSPYSNVAPTNEFSNNGFVDNGFSNNELNNSHFTPTSSNGSNQSNNPAPKPHTQRTRTQCPNCTETFSRKSDFERHHESVHLGIKYHCDFPGCHNNRGQGYCRAEKLKTHRREMHGVI